MLKNNKGSTSIIIALTIVVLLGIAALVIDLGLFYLESSKITNAVDAAALAGSQLLFEDNELAENIAFEYIEKNGFNKDDFEVVITDVDKSITVSGSGQVEYFFARVLGINQGMVKASATAIAGPIRSVDKGLRPFGIFEEDLEFGKKYTLKEGAQGGQTGNFGFISLGGSGAAVLGRNIRYGYDGKVEVGDMIQTQPGNIASIKDDYNALINNCTHGCTFDNYELGCSRIITVVMFDPPVPTGSGWKTVTGFAVFLLDNTEAKPPYGHFEISGYFLEYGVSGEIDSSLKDFGVRSTKLTKKTN